MWSDAELEEVERHMAGEKKGVGVKGLDQ